MKVARRQDGASHSHRSSRGCNMCSKSFLGVIFLAENVWCTVASYKCLGIYREKIEK